MAIVPTLLTPLILSVTPATIDLPNAQYNHLTQGADVVAQYRTSTRTSNGTRTYDWQGKPQDADDDRESD